MVIERGAETQILMAYVKEGDTETLSWVENIVTIIVLERTREVTECVQNIVVEALRIKAMERNTTEDIFSYMRADEMINLTLINIGIGDRAKDTYSLRRLSECINAMQGTIMRDTEHEQSKDIEQVD